MNKGSKPEEYVHGDSEEEGARLLDQADTLSDLLHHDTRYSADDKILEAGCGVGAQTVVLAKNSPLTRFTSVDVSQASIDQARSAVKGLGLANVSFQVADIFNLPFEPESFDHLFVCFTLEHLGEPMLALEKLKTVLKPGGTITLIEGDHGSTYFHPDSRLALRTIECLVEMQAEGGGDANIGRRLFPLLNEAGFKNVGVSPRMVYADASRPELVEGFTKKTFIAMVDGVRQQALDAGLMNEAAWDQGIGDMRKAAEPDGTFCYTFFKATATK